MLPAEAILSILVDVDDAELAPFTSPSAVAQFAHQIFHITPT